MTEEHPGAVDDEDVEPTHLCGGRLDEAACCHGIGEVGGRPPDTEVGRRGLRPTSIGAADRDLHALRDERGRDRSSKP